MDSSTSASSVTDAFQNILTSTTRTVTVKFTTEDNKVFTQSYIENITIGEIKDILVEVFCIPIESISITHNNVAVAGEQQLCDFELGQFDTLEFQLFSTDATHSISAENAYKDIAVPDILTVRVDDSDEEEGYKDVVVEILDKCIKKPFLGGFVHKETGVEYHHGYSQTGPLPPKVPPYKKNHRDTQTYWLRNRKLDTYYSRATQMSSNDVWIPNVTDTILTAGPYETADEWEARRDVLGKVRIIQRYFRAWKMRKALKVLSAEYKKRVRLENEYEEYLLREDEERKKQELVSKVFPRTKADFCMLYAMVDRWKRAEIQRISKACSGPAKITEFYIVLDKEIQMLQAIEAQRNKVKQDMKIQKDIEFFKTIGTPLDWNSHYKNLYVQMDTIETQKGREYHQMYLAVCDQKQDKEDQLQALLNVKLTLRGHNCRLSNELISLIDRACELIVRGLSNQHLDMLRKRIEGLLLKHLKTPECNEGVTNRMTRVKEKLMTNDLFYCSRCQKLKSHKEFAIYCRIDKLKVCSSCTWDDRVIEPWIDMSPYRYILRCIRREERRKQSPSSLAFVVQDIDIHHLVTQIWHSRSAINESPNIHNLRLCRWFKDENWAPWNCILLSVEEVKSHLKIRKLEDVYDGEFLHHVFNKHYLAKSHFMKALRLENEFQKIGEFDTKWNEIKESIEFVAVNSRSKIFLSCH